MYVHQGMVLQLYDCGHFCRAQIRSLKREIQRLKNPKATNKRTKIDEKDASAVPSKDDAPGLEKDGSKAPLGIPDWKKEQLDKISSKHSGVIIGKRPKTADHDSRVSVYLSARVGMYIANVHLVPFKKDTYIHTGIQHKCMHVVHA